MIKILRPKWIFIMTAVLCFFFAGQTAFAWVESPANPTYDPIVAAEKAYFPSVLKMGSNDYRMWYQSNSTPSNATIAYATSIDGQSWTLVTNQVSGLLPDTAGHPHVEFTDGKFRIWYWNAVTPYGNNAIHYAESTDGITWTNDAPITGNLITSASGQWNSGSYGAVDVIINGSPTNTGANPFDYKYAMYYDATSGGYEQIALGYSADGIAWTLYGTGPVLSKGLIGSWDSGYVTAGTVIPGSVWEMWYSGGVSASNEGIGYATSTDGLTWTKSATNPFMSKNDGVAWRNNRTYTPSVIKDGTDYKMWFTGRDTAVGNYAIGYATLAGPPTTGPIFIDTNVNGVLDIGEPFFTSIQAAINAASSGNTIYVTAGTYTGAVNDTKGITLRASGVAMIVGQVTLNAAGSKIYGFDITNPGGNFGILINGFGNTEASNNVVHTIGTGATVGANFGIYFQDINLVDADNIKIQNNTISNIGTTVNGSNSGIGIEDSAGNSNLTGVMIVGNTISNITANTTPVSPGKGAYGIIINHAIHNSVSNMGSTSGAQITGNTISNLNGRWAHGIGLEGNTPNAVVTGNVIHNVTASSIPSDASAVTFQDNSSAASVTLRNNNFDITTISLGVENLVPSAVVDVAQNYWGMANVDITKFYGLATVSPWYVDSGMTTRSDSATLHIIKLVINGSGGTGPGILHDFDFMVHVKNASTTLDVLGSPVVGAAAPGTSYSLSAGTYTISEDVNTSYVKSFSLVGVCDSSGTVTLAPGDNKTCTMINTDIPAPLPVEPRGYGGYTLHFTPLIGILKVPTPLALSEGPGSVTYNYTVWNVGGQQPLVGVSVADDKCRAMVLRSGDINKNGKLDTDENWRYSCTTMLSTTTTNTAIATGYSDDALRQVAIATAVTTVVVGAQTPPPLIAIVKVPSRLTIFPFGGGDVTYTYGVTNPGVVAIHDVTVTDDKCKQVSGPLGDANRNKLLDPGEVWAYTCKMNVPISTRNAVTVEGKANGFIALGYAFADVLVATPGFPEAGSLAVSATSSRGITVAQAKTTFHRSLGIGSKGDDVEALQTALEQKGLLVMPAGVVKGYLGSLTRAAISKYQASVGLPQVGVFGPLTRAKLTAELEQR